MPLVSLSSQITIQKCFTMNISITDLFHTCYSFLLWEMDYHIYHTSTWEHNTVVQIKKGHIFMFHRYQMNWYLCPIDIKNVVYNLYSYCFSPQKIFILMLLFVCFIHIIATDIFISAFPTMLPGRLAKSAQLVLWLHSFDYKYLQAQCNTLSIL